MKRPALSFAVLAVALLILSTAASSAVVYVKWDSPGPILNGASWDTAYHTVQAGLNAATSGGEVRVARGTYVERITLKAGVALYGGYAGVGDMRNLGTYSTKLDGGHAGAVVSSPPGLTNTTRIDGFTIRNGYAHSGGGICCYSSPTIANNVIGGNTAYYAGGGIYCADASPTITNNRIMWNSALDGGGIFCDFSSAPTITNNAISGNTASFNGGGVSCESSSTPTITNNTILVNTATMSGGGLYSSYSSPKVSNNIIAFNSSGIYREGWTPTLRNNCLFSNHDYNYSGISAGTGDISADPLIVDWVTGDHHMMPLSPCINAGWNEAPGLPWYDMDGEGRVFGRKVDIGADEFWSPEMSISDARFAADGAKISGQGAIVTAEFPGFFYIESDDRSCGIRVETTLPCAHQGDRADVIGILRTSADGERYIEAPGVSPSGTGSITPVRVTGRTIGGGNWFYNPTTGAGQKGVLGGAGLNNIGLLVRTWGKVTHVGDGFFYFDDGSDLQDGSGFAGVKSLVASPGLPAEGDYVRATGISSCFRDGENLHRLLRVREWSKEQSAAPVAMAGGCPDICAVYGSGGILLLWDDPFGIRMSDIIEFHIWRDGPGLPNNTPVFAPCPENAPPTAGSAGAYDHSAVDDEMANGPLAFHYADSNHELLQIASVQSVPGITLGVTHSYWVSALYRRINPNDASITYWETSPVSAGQATLVSRPTCVSPDQAMDQPLSGITFEWNPSLGADMYRVEVSTQPDFQRHRTWCKDVPKLSPPYSITVNDELDIAPELANVQAGQTLYWRVGARKSTDTPGPYPAGIGSSGAVSGPNNTRFIYCGVPFQFTVDMPPDDGGGGGGDPPPPPGL